MTVSIYAANVVSWTVTAVAILLTWARYHARYLSPRGFLWDDVLHGFALVFLLIEVSTFYVAVGLSTAINAYEDGRSDVQPDFARFQRLLLVWRSMVWSCVWAVKFGYLVLYRDIFGSTCKRFRIAWWAVFVFNFLSYVAAMAATFVYCGGSAANLLNETICDSEAVDMLQYRFLIYGGVLNIVTDLAVMALPLAMLRTLPLSKVQKGGLVLIFCLSFAEIVAESARLAESNPAIGRQSVNFLVTSLESSTAVVLSCIPSLHYLVQKRAVQRRASGGSGSSQPLGGSKFGSFSGSFGFSRKDRNGSAASRSSVASDATMSSDGFDDHLQKLDRFAPDAAERV